MNLPDHSEDVAGVEEPAEDPILTLKQRIRWKARALHAERALDQVGKDERFWFVACVFLTVTWLLTMAALVVAVGVK